MAQITTNGISGGCLTTPLTESWGNDNAIYCSKYIDSAGYSSSTRIAFKYDTTQLNTANFDRAVTVFLRPNADFNHYVIASITHDKKIQIVTYSAVNNPFQVNLIHNHWYEFILNTSFTTPAPVYQVTSSVQLNDLGLTGLTPPIPAGNSNLNFTDSLLYVDTAVQVSFSGTQWGGAKYLENFRFQGMKSADSCNTSTGIPTFQSEGVAIFVTGNTLNITNPFGELSIQLYSIAGGKVFSGKALPGRSSLLFAGIENGVYLLRVSGIAENYHLTKKLVILE